MLKNTKAPQIDAPHSSSMDTPAMPLANDDKAISETSIDDNDNNTDNDDHIPVDEIDEPLAPTNNSDASEHAPPIRIIVARSFSPFSCFPPSSAPPTPLKMWTKLSSSTLSLFSISLHKILSSLLYN